MMSEWKEQDSSPIITQQFIKELLHYDPDTGIFTWNKSKGNARKGSEAGWIANQRCKKYRIIMINGKSYYAHRLACLYVYGYLPEHDTDHINGDGLDNKISNIRYATTTENCRNRRVPSNNKSGIIGVSWEKKVSKWRVRISHNGKLLCLGLFSNLQSAAEVRKEAENKYGYHENHGSSRPL